MIVHHEDAPAPPPCWNRESGPASYTRYGIDQLSGERIEVEIRMDWAKPGCQSWAPGIGQPTVEYPSGTPYPIAHGWAKWCALCKWAPPEATKTKVADCGCRQCSPVMVQATKMIVCPGCGYKRCPRANFHGFDCTGSNDPGQLGSAY